MSELLLNPSPRGSFEAPASVRMARAAHERYCWLLRREFDIFAACVQGLTMSGARWFFSCN